MTLSELDSFHRFAAEKLQNDGAEYSLEDVLFLWREAQQRDAVNAAIQEGVDAMHAGQVQPFDETMEEIRRDLRIPAR